MKKTLLLTTSLVGLGFASNAYAADVIVPAEKIENPVTVTVGGYFTSGFFLHSTDAAGVSEVGKAVSTDGEIQFNAKIKLENGMTAGVRVELEAFTAGDQIDEHYIYLTSGFGTIKLGAEDAASNLLSANGPFYGIGTGADAPTFNAGVLALTATMTRFSGDANKITYLSPSIGGFQAGVSFTPSTVSTTGTGGATDAQLKTTTTYHDVISAAAKFSSDLGGVNVAIAAGMESGKTDSTAAIAASKRNITVVGLSASMSGATIGARYSIDKQELAGGTLVLTENKDKAYNVSASYALGDIHLGVGYFNAKNTAGDKSTRLGAGVKYSLGSGVDAAFSFTSEKQEDIGAAAVKGSLIGLELGASF